MSFIDNPIVFLTLRSWKYSKKFKVVLFYFLFLCSNAVYFLEPLVIGYVLNRIQLEGIHDYNIVSLIMWLSFIIWLVFGFWFFHGFGRLLEMSNAFSVRANYKKYLLDGVMDLPLEWHSEHHSGDTIDKIEKGVGALYQYASHQFEVIEAVLLLSGSMVAIFYFNLVSGSIMLFMFLLSVFIILRFDKLLVVKYNLLNKSENAISKRVFDALSNITTVVVLRIEKLVSRSIMAKILEPYELFKAKNRLTEIKWFTVSVLASSSIFLVLLFYILSQKSGILVGSIFVIYSYAERISSLFYRFAYMYGDIVEQKTKVLNSQLISDCFVEKVQGDEKRLSDGWDVLGIRNLYFCYSSKRGHLHLENVSLNVSRGEKIALIGKSGSGKTTFLKVLKNLYEPQSVNVFVDGDYVEGGFKEFSGDVTLIPQEPEIFSTTIKDNITLGAYCKLSFVKRFTDMACFTPVIKKLPKKLYSLIGEKGVNLSGGEKQRLALSRGLLASYDKEILLLDEPTSSVDSKNELAIYRNIFSKLKRKTIISSVHRLHLLPMFDRVIFFKKGKIVASGSFRELLLNCREFKLLWSKYKRVLKK